MKVLELIELLKKMPPYADVKTDNGEYLENPEHVEEDSRGYVIIRSS
ncbi:hypothetical protein HPY28_04790 [Brevibacillus sp. HB1.2]|nr:MULTISPECIES: hypothetical protein [unclassified Brevibacillus]NRS15642.1 hypothetical protein [Brevibacillus sp. HB1.4B]NTU19633.1 hypothetical protein [Brevibacillus sp. HB1.2]